MMRLVLTLTRRIAVKRFRAAHPRMRRRPGFAEGFRGVVLDGPVHALLALTEGVVDVGVLGEAVEERLPVLGAVEDGDADGLLLAH
jgi:hypothetical protein